MRRYLTIEHDQYTESPADDCCQWRLVSFNPRHRNHKDASDYSPLPIGLRRKLQVGLAFVLDYYEHGGSAWSLAGRGMQCPWDTSKNAGLLIWDHTPSEIGAKTYAERAADASRFLDTYNDWANGNCYYFSLEDGDGEHLDSCGGFIGLEHLADTINEHLSDDDEIIVRGSCSDLAQYMKLRGEIVDEFTSADELAGDFAI